MIINVKIIKDRSTRDDTNLLDRHLLTIEALHATLQIMKRNIGLHAAATHVLAKVALDADIWAPNLCKNEVLK